MTKSDVESLILAFDNFEFLLGMVIWYEILFAINSVNKNLQAKFVCIDNSLKQLEGVVFLEKFRHEGFASSLSIAQNIPHDMDVDHVLPNKRHIFRKKQFDETRLGEEVLTGEDDFRVNYFLVVVDMTINSVKNKFDQMVNFRNVFGFLFDLKNIKGIR